MKWCNFRFDINTLLAKKNIKDNFLVIPLHGFKHALLLCYHSRKKGKRFLKRQYWLSHIVLWWKVFSKTLSVEPYFLFVKVFEKENMYWTIFLFWSNFPSKAIWVEPYCLSNKIFLKHYMVWTKLSFGQNFLKRR